MAKSKADLHAPDQIDQYLNRLEPDQRKPLEGMRNLILTLVPDCTQRVSYGVPIFRKGKDLVGIGAAKGYCSFYTMSTALVQQLAAQLKGFHCKGSTIHFTKENPLPEELVTMIVQARLAEMSKA